MKEIIKKNIGWVGFVIGIIMIFVGYYYNEYESLAEFGFFLWISSMTIDMELKKPKPKIWYTYLVAIVFFVFTFICLS
jgi:uncharacterized membrane protein